MTRNRTSRLATLLVAMGLAIVLAGCSGPRYRQKREERDARITHGLSVYAAHDAAGVDRIHQTLVAKEQLDQRRAEHLTDTCNLVRTEHERDVRRWNEGAPLRRDRVAAYFRGKPERIADTWAKIGN